MNKVSFGALFLMTKREGVDLLDLRVIIVVAASAREQLCMKIRMNLSRCMMQLNVCRVNHEIL